MLNWINFVSFSSLLISVIICLFRFKCKNIQSLLRFLLGKETIPILSNQFSKRDSGLKLLKIFIRLILYGHNLNKSSYLKSNKPKNICWKEHKIKIIYAKKQLMLKNLHSILKNSHIKKIKKLKISSMNLIQQSV